MGGHHWEVYLKRPAQLQMAMMVASLGFWRFVGLDPQGYRAHMMLQKLQALQQTQLIPQIQGQAANSFRRLHDSACLLYCV